MHIMYFLYVIQSVQTGRLYVGITDDIEKRIKKHNARSVRSTKAYAPYTLVKVEEFDTKTEARKRELQLKKAGHLKRTLLGTRGPIV